MSTPGVPGELSTLALRSSDCIWHEHRLAYGAVTVPSAAPELQAKTLSSAVLPGVPLWLSVPQANPYLKGFKAGPHPLVFQAGHPAPELLLVVEIEGAHHHGGPLAGAKKQIAAEIRATGGEGPLVTHQGGEHTGLVVALAGLHAAAPGAGGLEVEIQRSRSCSVLRPRSSCTVGSLWPGAPGWRIVSISRRYSTWSVTAARSRGLLSRKRWPLTSTVERAGGVDVRFAEAGLLLGVLGRNGGAGGTGGPGRGGGEATGNSGHGAGHAGTEGHGLGSKSLLNT